MKMSLEFNLAKRVLQQTEYARETGALQSIETDYHFIEQEGIPFIVRTLTNLIRKEKDKQQQLAKEVKTGKIVDPFLPYEADLFVCDISPTHLCLLNKFNVVENHLLIVTRAFEEQDDLLNLNDFAALWTCMQQMDGLAFYNGGKAAGASQRHKHLQLVPLPFVPDTPYLPIQKAIDNAVYDNEIGTIPSFAFRHAIAQLDIDTDNPLLAAKIMFDLYYDLLEAVNLRIIDPPQQPGAYNFLATKNWMSIIPRSQESFRSISVNSLGFAGSLFVRDAQALELLQEITPIAMLQQVGFTR
jgi:ATP adenylyltransferase